VLTTGRLNKSGSGCSYDILIIAEGFVK
jgi:hypothetical protein